MNNETTTTNVEVIEAISTAVVTKKPATKAKKNTTKVKSVNVKKALKVKPDGASAAEVNQYSKLVEQYTAAFNYFNEKLFDGKLKMPIITIQSQGRKSVYGWFFANSWSEGGEKSYNEINMAAENINRSKDQQCETLIHEMVHLYNSQEGLKDCNALQYHNNHFKAGCDMVGLHCEKKPGKGWAFTSLTEELRVLINNLDVSFIENIARKKVESSYTKCWFISVREEDHEWFKAMRNSTGMTQKQLFSAMKDSYMQCQEGYDVEV